MATPTPNPTPTYEQMRDMFRAHTEAAVKMIVDIMSGNGGKGDAVRLSAAKEILTRGWGKPGGQEKKIKLPPQENPEYRGKALTQIVADEAAAEGRDPPWGKAVPAERPAAPPPSAPSADVPAAPKPPTAATAAASPPPLPPAAMPAARSHDDPTGYKARRALWSGPAGAGKN
jgi:hypothetical protein